MASFACLYINDLIEAYDYFFSSFNRHYESLCKGQIMISKGSMTMLRRSRLPESYLLELLSYFLHEGFKN